MSVAAIGTSAPMMGHPSATTHQKLADARPNTGHTGGKNASLFRGMPGNQQKLPVSRIPDIVARMQRETQSSSAKRGQWYKSDSYIDPKTYSWKNLSLFSDYQAHMWTESGGIKDGYKK